MLLIRQLLCSALSFVEWLSARVEHRGRKALLTNLFAASLPRPREAPLMMVLYFTRKLSHWSRIPMKNSSVVPKLGAETHFKLLRRGERICACRTVRIHRIADD
jgi:hypothetical protein